MISNLHTIPSNLQVNMYSIGIGFLEISCSLQISSLLSEMFLTPRIIFRELFKLD